MSILQAILLGLVQGLTEFLPISSSGHLVLTNHFFDIRSFTFDVLLNIGTLLALLVFYRRKIIAIIIDIIFNKNFKLLIKLIIATIPAVLIGFLFDEYLQKISNSIPTIIVMLGLIGLLMVVFGEQKNGKLISRVDRIPNKSALLIGMAQVIALIPGTSRSGITILTAINRRVSYATAAEFSFLLAIPTISGAIMKTILFDDTNKFIAENIGSIMVGNLFSFISGILAIRFLIKILSSKGLRIFGYYRIVLSLVLLSLYIVGII